MSIVAGGGSESSRANSVFRLIDSPKERLLRQQNTAYKESYAVLQERTKQLELQMIETQRKLEDFDRRK